MEFLVALFSIMMVNIVLSGDNAVVIAMASRALPQEQQKKAILWGSAGAIGLRIILTFVAIILLQIPYLQFAGGILLIWIAAKLLLENHDDENVQASASLGEAVKTIIIADLVMSLDNTLAIASVAKGDYLLLGIGMLLSIPLITFGSSIIIKLMDRFPVIVYIGSALIAWTAGEMMMHDQRLGGFMEALMPEWLLPLAITVSVLALGIWWNKYRHTTTKQKQVEG